MGAAVYFYGSDASGPLCAKSSTSVTVPTRRGPDPMAETTNPARRIVSLETDEMSRLRLRRRPAQGIKNYPVPG